MGGYSKIPGGGGSLASCLDDNPDLNWGSCSPGEERFITVTRDGAGTTLTALGFSGDTGSFEITSLDGTSIGPFSCTTYPNLDLALGDAGALLYGEAVTVGISTAFDTGAAASMDIAILDANGATVATRTATATVEDAFVSLLETHGDLLYAFTPSSLANGDLSGDGAVAFVDQSSVTAPNVIYKKHAGQSVLWRVNNDDACGASAILAKYLESDYRAGVSDAAAYQYAIAESDPGAAQTLMLFIKLEQGKANKVGGAAEYCTIGGIGGAPTTSPFARSFSQYLNADGFAIGFSGEGTRSATRKAPTADTWYCLCITWSALDRFSYAYTEMGQAWGNLAAWGTVVHGGSFTSQNGLQFGYNSTDSAFKNQDGFRIAGAVGFSGAKSEAQLIALYEAAAGI